VSDKLQSGKKGSDQYGPAHEDAYCVKSASARPAWKWFLKPFQPRHKIIARTE